MPKVLCTLPNASEEISGVKFASHANGMVSEEVSEEVAAEFAAVSGYSIVGAKSAADLDAEKAAADAAKAELLERAAAIDFKVKAVWSVERLKAEVESAEKAAAEKAPE